MIDWKLGALCSAVVMASCGCGDDDAMGPICDAASLGRVLSAATSGDVVELGACRIEASVVVPAGVTLRGRGIGMTTLHVLGGSEGVTLSPGDAPATLEDLSIESDGTIGIVARGAGDVAIHRVAVTAARGYGVGAEDVTTVTMTDVDVVGPVTAANLALLPAAPSRDATATRGIVLLRVTRAALTNVRASGFAVTGVYANAGRLEWNGGGASANYGIGALVYRADAVLADLSLGGTLRRGGEDTFGAVIANGATVSASRLDVSANGSYGILQTEASATYTDLVARGNGRSALWVQRSERAEITGASELRDNALAAIVGVESSGILVSDATIAGTRTAVGVGLEGQRIEIGDGVQLVDSYADVTLRALRLEGNARAGLLIDAGGRAIDGVTIDDVSVSGEGDALGAIAQDSIVGSGWDSGVTRDDVTNTNDAGFTGVLDVVSIDGPDWSAPPDDAGLD